MTTYLEVLATGYVAVGDKYNLLYNHMGKRLKHDQPILLLVNFSSSHCMNCEIQP